MPHRRVVSGRSQEPRRRFAEELRLLRAQKRVTFRELGERLGWDRSQFAKMESGETLGGPEVVEALEQFYDTTPGLLLALWELAVSDPTQFRERYRRYMTLEAGALSMWQYSAGVLPGLLQTRDYAGELLAQGGLSAEELRTQVEARIGRQGLLTRESPLQLRVIVSETALSTPLQKSESWREQLEHLNTVGLYSNVTMQVLPQSAGLHALTNTDTIFLRVVDGQTVAWVETGYSGELVQEPTAVDRLQLRYDRVRDLALSPEKSRQFIERMLEEAPCEPST
ncbi:helix-turn-helix domain-containing protein [Streptomyces sp. NPDC091377]|uniref:helix-turn-helix domain-containing protein n=1 Tax=Streptomyces sp. NPDC091377 TaxID=3365995 RepID=UPI0037F951DA